MTYGSDRVVLLGDEMLAWSDHEHGPISGGAMESLLRRVLPGGRILMAGPHSRELILSTLSPDRSVACLVRSLPDADMLADECGDLAQILCGSLAKFSVREEFDAIVALDGVDRLRSVEGAQISWAESVEILAAALRPGGTLTIGTPNQLGVHRLVAMPGNDAVAVNQPADTELDPTRPGSPRGLLRAMLDVGLSPGRLWVGYPLPSTPTVVADAAAQDTNLARSGSLSAAIAAAWTTAFDGVPLLSDPRRLATASIRSGLGTEFAPLWIVNAHRTVNAHRIVSAQRREAPASVAETTVSVASPATDPGVLVAEQQGPFGVVYELTVDSSGAVRRTIDTARDVVVGGGLTRDQSKLIGVVPEGRSLAEALLDACTRRDLVELRTLVGAWTQLAAADPFATAENVIITDAGMSLLDPSWSLDAPVEPGVSLARCLRSFAMTLLTGAHPNPWPSTMDANELTAVLGGLAGERIDRGMIAAAVALEVSLRTRTQGLTEDEEFELARRLAVVDVSATADSGGLRESQAAAAALRRELAHARAEVDWYESLLSSRERSLRRAQRTIDLMSGSMSYRIGRAVITPARWAKRLVRHLMSKARRLHRRLTTR